jgi:hypothetical protein
MIRKMGGRQAQFPLFFRGICKTTPTSGGNKMNAAGTSKITDIKIDPNNLYKEEAFTDLTFATIRRLTPVKIDGSIDESREPIFTGMTQLMSPNGPIPVQCLIEGAKTLSEAAAKLPEAIEKTVQAMIAEAEEMRRQEASKIIVPGQ